MSIPLTLIPLAWSYARTSTDRQAQDDRSGMDRQEQALAQWLWDHPLYQVAKALVDAGVSAGRGRNRTRGVLSPFLESARMSIVPAGSYLVVESMSRFSRESATRTLRTLIPPVMDGLRPSAAEADMQRAAREIRKKLAQDGACPFKIASLDWPETRS